MSIVLDGVSVVVAAPTASDGRSVKAILSEVSATLDERRVAVIGANGSGKSTLLRLLNGLAAATSGRVEVDGIDVGKDPRAARTKVGFVFTDPLSQLVMPTPAEDLELSLRRRIRDRGERRARALELLAERGIAHVADSSVYDISGGERQLVALASVLAVEPAILVLDEPTTLLDLRHRDRLRQVLARLQQQVLLATHDLDLALDADRVLVIDEGRIAFDGQPAAAVAFYRGLMGA